MILQGKSPTHQRIANHTKRTLASHNLDISLRIVRPTHNKSLREKKVRITRFKHAIAMYKVHIARFKHTIVRKMSEL